MSTDGSFPSRPRHLERASTQAVPLPILSATRNSLLGVSCSPSSNRAVVVPLYSLLTLRVTRITGVLAVRLAVKRLGSILFRP